MNRKYLSFQFLGLFNVQGHKLGKFKTFNPLLHPFLEGMGATALAKYQELG
jgi:hypothetical protein